MLFQRADRFFARERVAAKEQKAKPKGRKAYASGEALCSASCLEVENRKAPLAFKYNFSEEEKGIVGDILQRFYLSRAS